MTIFLASLSLLRHLPTSGVFKIAATPIGWRRELQSTNGRNRQEDKPTIHSSLTCKRAKNMLIQKKFKEPLESSGLQRLGVDPMMISASTMQKTAV